MRFSVVFASAGQKWDIMASILLSRPALIAPQMTKAEERFKQVQLEEEEANSLLSNFELRSIQDEKMLAKRAELEREGKELSELDGQIGITNATKEDEWKRRAQQLTSQYKLLDPQSYESTSSTSLNRKLDRKLTLIVKQTFGDKAYSSPWIFPQMKQREGETLRQTAERCLGNVTTGEVKVALHGNAPIAVHTHRYPKPLRNKLAVDGAKIFFFNAVLLPNSKFETNVSEVSDYQWATQEEIWSTVPSKGYKLAVRSSFIE